MTMLTRPLPCARSPRGARSAAQTFAACFALVAVSLVASPVGAQDIIPPKSYATTPGGINVADGSLVYSVTDLSIGPMRLERFHRTGSSQPNDPMFGWNFASNFEVYLSKITQFGNSSSGVVIEGYKLIAHLGGSASGTFAQSNGSNFVGPNNLDAEKGQLEWNGSQYVYTDSSGTIYTFSATVQAAGTLYQANSRKIERIQFPDGRVQTFSYNGSGYLKLVEDSSGYAMVFDYNGNGDVTAACAFVRAQTYVSATSTCVGAQRKTTYGYTYVSPRQLLTSATDVLAQVTSYTYSLGALTCIKPPSYASCMMTLNGPGRISSQTLLDGGTWTITGDDPTTLRVDDAPAPYNGHNEVTVTDPAGVTINLTFTKTSPYTMTDANGNLTRFVYEGAVPYNDPWAGYSDGTMLRQAIYPEGNQYLAEYIGPFKAITKETFVAKPGSGQPNLIKQYGYHVGSCTSSPATYQNCAKPLWIKDPAGNQTDYTYASHGGVLSEMAPAPAAGGARPLKLVTYTQRYAWVKNSSGTLVQATIPVWAVATETQCQTTAGSSTPVCDGSAQQTITTYEYGANASAESLLVKGVAVTADGQTLRSCSSYDSWHRKISETQPKAGLASCP